MPNWDATEADFAIIESWNLKEKPLAAIEDYSDEKRAKRFDNPEHVKAWDAYNDARNGYIQQKDFDHYYKTAKKPIDKNRWEYLRHRKAWFIAPLGWENFASKKCHRILDLGCGDGDITQNMADFIARTWEKQGYEGHDIEIIGLDLNLSRIENAQSHCETPHPKIKMTFKQGDAVGEPLPFEDNFFDYTMNTGVFEIIEDEGARRLMREIARVTKFGVFTEDVAELFPGGFPRENLRDYFKDVGFTVKKHHHVMSEPFFEDKMTEPKKLWPYVVSQLLYVEK